MHTVLPTIDNPAASRRVARSARRGIIEAIPGVEYTLTGDTFGYTPHIALDLRKADNMHHATRAALARRIARAVWGEHASVIHIGGGRYELVWCKYDVPLPEWMDARYGRYYDRGIVAV
jgi:hypothetical protein